MRVKAMLQILSVLIADPDPVFTSMRVHIQKAVLRIRINWFRIRMGHLGWIPIRIRIQDFNDQ